MCRLGIESFGINQGLKNFIISFLELGQGINGEILVHSYILGSGLRTLWVTNTSSLQLILEAASLAGSADAVIYRPQAVRVFYTRFVFL
jgi:hypothetical protein